MRRITIALVFVLSSLALIAAGCGGDDETSTTTPTTPSTTGATGSSGEAGASGGGTAVGMTEFSFDPNDITVKSGDTLQVSNDGATVHNLTVEGEDVATDDIEPGSSEDLTVDLAPGDYKFECTIADHAAQGMTGTLTVD
jgi:plastocyanin